MKRTKTKERHTHTKINHHLYAYGVPEYLIQGVITPLQHILLSDLYSSASRLPLEVYFVHSKPSKIRFIFSLGDKRQRFLITPTTEELLEVYKEAIHGCN